MRTFIIFLSCTLLMAQTAFADDREMSRALHLFDKGMYNHSRVTLDGLQERYSSLDPEGYSVLCDVMMQRPGYLGRMNRFIEEHPYSVLVPQLRYRHGLNLFDSGDYVAASGMLAMVSEKQIPRSERTGFVFKKAYCELEGRNMDAAMPLFKEVEARRMSDFTAPSRYAIGYICYEKKEFREAIGWFAKAASDERFRDMAGYYMMECRFMLKDYEYVVKHGEQMYDSVPSDRKPRLARIISESYLVLGDADNAMRYYNMNAAPDKSRTRSDWFYSGSVLYAVQDYHGAIDNFNMMGVKVDSIGQIADYQLGYSYIQTKNKVAAMDAFKEAAMSLFDADIAEDAHFNYAKLAFDLNNDVSVFQDYLKKYSHVEKGDRIYGYMAVAALHEHDYAGALEAYDKIDELDADMRSNYMKANYLRAHQLISNGSYRRAIPCLKASAYYSERGSRFNQLSRFWLAECYYRDGQYDDAKEILTDLHNTSALYGRPESYLISYNIAYCHFKKEEYEKAGRWFSDYLGEGSVRYRKEALLRKGDCHFIRREYKEASQAYDAVLKDYFDVNDIYPYYQAALSYGLDRNLDRKVELLTNVHGASPDSDFYPEALFELGRCYALREDDDNAFRCFNTLADTVRDSTFIAKAYIEMGSLARNQSQYEEALGYYKTVVAQMPLSGYADDALAAIESIYQTNNNPEEYLAYIESIGKGNIKTSDERETMIFNSAEQVFLSENWHKAITALQSYQEKYPQGRNVYKADFYIAESYKNLDNPERACDFYKKVIEGGEGSFVELSMLNFANLSYRMEKWDDAFRGYSSLHFAAKLENNRYTALVGMMRSAYRAHDWENALSNADRVLAEVKDAQKGIEAEYIKAKSYLASSRRAEAFAVLEKLAAHVNDPYGAEANYLMVTDSYDRGDFQEVEKRVYAFSDSGTGQTYWLAKCFIVLGDSFADREEYAQAKATFESVRDGYSPSGENDDIHSNVGLRLKKLEELMTL